MGIEKITIRNFKSIKYCNFSVQDNTVNTLIGKNGGGKSNFIEALDFYYQCMSDNYTSMSNAIDCKNPYTEKLCIEIVYDFKMLHNFNSNVYIDEMLLFIEPYIINNKVCLKLIQYKDGRIKWYPTELNIRKAILKFFPLFKISTRALSLNDWSDIWEIISQLSISTVKLTQEDLKQRLKQIWAEAYGEKFVKALTNVENIFNKENIEVNNLDYKSRFKNALLTYLGGSDFLSEDFAISYYSDGLNSLKYIKLCVELISALAHTGWKNPLVLIDEPEIGLHPQYIDELTECLCDNLSHRWNIIITTHSSTLISNLGKAEKEIRIHRVFMKYGYSMIEELNNLLDSNKYLMSEKEANCYFSDVILFVEGKTELQVLSNINIIKLYPFLKRIKIYNFDSDNTHLKLIHPDKVKISIPYLMLVDMDKIINYSYKRKKFSINADGDINPLYEKSNLKTINLCYIKEGQKCFTNNLRKRILGICKKTEFNTDVDQYWIQRNFFYTFLDLIQEYCFKYNIYPVSTTIEGCIINNQSWTFVVRWLKQSLPNPELLDELLDSKTQKHKLNILRLLFNGKTDALQTFKNLHRNGLVNTNDKNLINRLQNNIGGKVDGWIMEFWKFYFKSELESLNDEEKKRNLFENHFRELATILHSLNNMLY